MKKVFDSKMFWIIIIVVLSLTIVGLGCYYILSKSFKINGESIVYMNYNEEYIDEGATVKLFNIDLSDFITKSNNIDSSKIGSYKITYNFKYLLWNFELERKIYYVDTKQPIITVNVNNESNGCPNYNISYTAIDEYDGDITDKVKVEYDNDLAIYEVTDSSGNKTRVVKTIVTKDEEAPTITLKGSKSIYIKNSNSYVEPGYEVSDNCDVNVKVSVSGKVDTSVDGVYTLKYTAKDSFGNQSVEKRNIYVYTDNEVGAVYLTFDDGPSGSGSTKKILDILKEEGIKATFFVTGGGPDALIKREYEEGHTVALHTYTHTYSQIYSSDDNYFADLEKVRNRVYNITGEYSNIIRFPGGSNNTISNRYSQGIMDRLRTSVAEKGYIFFDWNVCGEDAASCAKLSDYSQKTKCVYNNVVNHLSKKRINVVLLHDIKMYTADALKDIITYCKNNGYEFYALTEGTMQVKFGG